MVSKYDHSNADRIVKQKKAVFCMIGMLFLSKRKADLSEPLSKESV